MRSSIAMLGDSVNLSMSRLSRMIFMASGDERFIHISGIIRSGLDHHSAFRRFPSSGITVLDLLRTGGTSMLENITNRQYPYPEVPETIRRKFAAQQVMDLFNARLASINPGKVEIEMEFQAALSHQHHF